MTKGRVKWLITSLATLLAAILCLWHLFHLPMTGAWLHEEYFDSTNFTVGTINFLFYNRGTSAADADAYFKPYIQAPTRYFNEASWRPDPATVPTGDNAVDDNFDMAVNVKQIRGANTGDVDILVNVSLKEDNHLITNNKLYYIFVPIDETDSNYTTHFLSGEYRAYLDALFLPYISTLGTDTGKRTAMEAINDDNTERLENIPIGKTEKNKLMFYILIWAEYDNSDWKPFLNTPMDLGEFPAYDFVLKAEISQKKNVILP